MGDEQVAPPVIEGILVKGRWSSYIGHGPFVTKWFEDRLREMPDGAYVRFTAEVLDPHPEENDRGHRH